MEYKEGKSIPLVKDYQVECSWDPWTPIKPSLTQSRAIYNDSPNGVLNQATMREPEDFLSRFSPINQTQTKTLFSGSMERNMQNAPNFDDIWGRGDVELQRRGLEEYLPNWNRQGITMHNNYSSVNQSLGNYPCLNSMDLSLSWRNTGVRENVEGMLGHLSEDPFGQFHNMSFGDLLGMKGSGFEPSMVSTRLGDYSSVVMNPPFIESSSTFRNQEALQDLNQEFNGVFGQVENNDFINQKWNLSDVDPTPVNKHTGEGSGTLAPPTPDLLWRKGSPVTVENTSFPPLEKPNEQNRAQVNKINQDLNNKQVTEAAASNSPGQVAENHNLDKGDLDLNKTPHKKPRRKRYMPKVVKENKPNKRTPNPKTPNLKDPLKPKRTYVRKSKPTPPPPSVSCPNEAAKTIDRKVRKPVVKSCKKSLRFDLNGQVNEDDPSLEEELVVESSQVGVAYDLNQTIDQELKNYMPLPEKDNLGNSNSSPCASSNEGVKKRGSKRGQYVDVVNEADDCGKFGQTTHNSLVNADGHEIPGIHFPGICKKRRTDKGQRPITPSKYYSTNQADGTDTVTSKQVEMLMRNTENRVQFLNTWLDISRLKKKRTKSTTRVRDLASLEGIASISKVKSASRGARRRSAVSDGHCVGNASYIDKSNSVYDCSEALAEEVNGTSRSKGRNRKGKSVVAHSTSSKTNEGWDLVLYDGKRSVKNRRGRIAKAPLIKTASLEAIIEGLKLLNINKKERKVSNRGRNALVPYRGKNTEQNALVPYGNEGTLVPYEGPFDPIRKRRQRARVDLDDETTRVWRLLLENIDNEGIDGTDEEKAKWWENERGVFRGRVDSFIARMRLVQGDRRFTPWKGSVLDSVIGVFLTQNVSDHLSSSAFMSLAARFPIKSDSSESTLSEEGSSTLVVEQEVCVTEPEESITWNEKSKVIYSLEEKEVVNGINDATSSQQSVISSQNSIDSPNLHRVMNTFSDSNLKYDYFGSTSFLGLLKMAETPFFNDYNQVFDLNQFDFFKEVPGISHIKGTTGIETIEESNITAGTTGQSFIKDKDLTPRSSPENVSSCYVLEGEEMIMQSVWKSPNVKNSSQQTADVTESTTKNKDNHKEAEQNSKNKHTSSGTADEIGSKAKKGKSVKDKKNAYDWDKLRKQAQVNGCKKERTANTRDSIDWEAVMHADVRVISDTIRERGMNNMLAERIKDLLDRLVKEHGSIDLEWLRDIPPDKAKEYLLSFRGLGLKSVECVRLLTLHHLAFPVDTNVGRIAVRLGWVPLQPLPEQLQLHLLELYPVLESIQKYLWPRLCKLDQKTLYELHYHMITFGKVFCTKRQPNCNACPLRGECRHFASAFASARLALPGPEERRIVPSVGGSSTHVNSQTYLDPLPLPLWNNHYTETNARHNNGVPTVEVPSTPLSLPSPHQPTLHLEGDPRINSEPIVEIPASPEPEQEQLCDIEDVLYEDPNEIPTIKLNMKEFTQTLQNFMEANRELQETGMSQALVALTPEIASIPTPKLKNISRLRTEHHVYELPDTHPLLKGMDKRERDDPCSYLLAIWTPGETADSIQPPERRCNFDDPSVLCNEETCSYCSSQREANSKTVRGTLLIPCRTAMRGSFPLNGTYFQVNEVFADHDSSLKPIDVPRSWLWNLPRRTVYFGTSVPTIFRGMSTEDIQHCFWRGYVCVRGFDQRTRAPRPLMARLHFPASRMPKGGKGKTYDDE